MTVLFIIISLLTPLYDGRIRYNAIDLASICFISVTIGVWLRYYILLQAFQPDGASFTADAPTASDTEADARQVLQMNTELNHLTQQLDSLRTWIGVSMA